MQYMLLLYDDPSAAPEPDSPEAAADFERWMAVTQEMADAGVMVGGEALLGAETATTVRVREGDTLLSDGPFAETKEHLGGYYILDVPDLDTACAWAAKLPNAPTGSIEVRPVMEIPAPT